MIAAVPDVPFMRKLEDDFVRERMAGIRNPAKYKIFYSGIGRSSAIMLGINPAGSEESFLTARQLYEEWGHDFLEYEFDPNYKLAKGAMRFLRRIVGEQPGNADDVVRRIPVSNVCFLRSQSPNNLTDENYLECEPYVRRIVCRVDPVVAIAVGDRAFEKLKAVLGATACIKENANRAVTTANGRHRATLYRSHKVHSQGHRLRLVLQIGHLSKFGLGRDDDWSMASSNLECDLAEVGLRPFVVD